MELKELGEKIDALMSSVKQAQTQTDEVKNEVSGAVQDSIKAATEVATEAQAAIQKHQQEVKASEDAMQQEIKAMQKKLARQAASGDHGNDEANEVEAVYRKEFSNYLRKQSIINDESLMDISRGLVEKAFSGLLPEDRLDTEVKDLVAGVNPNGGYFIRPQRSATMIKRIFETSPMRLVSNIETVTTDALEMIIDDNEADTGGWVGEVDTRPNTDTPQIGKLVIPIHEQYAQPRATQKMLDDGGFDVEAWLADKVTTRMSRFENTAFVRGDGSQKPKGWAGYADTGLNDYERFKIGTAQLNAALTGDDLKLLQNALKEEYQPNATWGMKRQTFGNIITLKDNDGQYIFQDRFLNTRDQMVLLGKPIVFMDDLDELDSEDGISIGYADFKQAYTIVDRIGFRVLRDDLTEKPYIKYYTTKRVGGDVTSYDAIKRIRNQAPS